MVVKPGSMGSDNAQIAAPGTGLGALAGSVFPLSDRPPIKEAGHGGNSILPWAHIVDIYEEVPELAWPASNSLWERMRRDAQVEAVMKAITLPIRRYRWVIDPNGAKDEHVSHIADDLGLPIKGHGQDEMPKGRTRGRFNHDDHLRHAFLALVFGHMFMEQFGIIGDDELFHLRKLAPRMPGTIQKIVVARDGGLEGIVQHPAGYGWQAGPGDDPNGIPISVSRLVAYVNEREGGNWVGRSVFRAIYKNWLIKDRLLRVDALKHERNGMGIPFAEAPPNATPKQIADLSALAQSTMAGDQSGGALPNGAKMTLQGVQGTLPDTIASIRYHDQQMSRIFLEMFMELGTTASGSRALGGTFIEFFDMAQEAIADWYVDTTNAHVIEDIVDWNWGTEVQAPRLSYEKSEDKSLSVADLVGLVQSGALTVDDETEAWFRARWQMPQMATPRPAPTPPAPAPTTGPAASTVVHARAPRGLWSRVRAAVLGTPAVMVPNRELRRQPSAVEAASGVDFAQLEADFTAARDAGIADWTGIQAQQISELAALIAQAVDDGDLEALGSLAPMTTGGDVLATRMLAMARTAAAVAVAEAAVQNVTVTIPTIDEKLVAARANVIALLMASSLSEVMGRRALTYAQSGATGAEVAALVVEYVNGLSGSYIEDRMTGAMMSAQNYGRYEVWSQVSNATFYASELLDSATCANCATVDGTDYADLDTALDDYPAGGYKDCAGGERCRGTLVAVMDTEAAPSKAA